MSEAAFNLDRDINIKNNVDVLGKKWHIVTKKGGGLVMAQPEPYRADFVCPSNMAGLWTNRTKLQDEITKYLMDSWDKAEAKQVQVERTETAVKEAAVREKAAQRAEKK